MAAHIYVYNLIIYIQGQVLFNIHFLTAFYVTLLSKKKNQNLRNKRRSLSSHTCCTVYIEFLCSTLRSKRPCIMNPFCSWIWLPCTFHRQAALFSVSKCQHTCISVVESQCVHKTWWNTPSPRALYNTIPITHQFHGIHLYCYILWPSFHWTIYIIRWLFFVGLIRI